MQPTIIGIAGKAGNGKDCVYKAIHNLTYKSFEVKRIAFADGVKKEVADACAITMQDIEDNKERFRPLLQWWGTDFRRYEQPNYWLDIWRSKMAWIKSSLAKSLIVVPDVRFLNEVEAIKAAGGVVWYVVAVNKPSITYSITDAHSSENQLEYYQHFDFHIKNEWNKTSELIEKIRKELININILPS